MNKPNKNIHIFGGGTVAHIASHLAVSAPAYGMTAMQLYVLCEERFNDGAHTVNVRQELTKMAGGRMETNEDVSNRLEELKADPNTMIIFMNAALVDFNPQLIEHWKEKYSSNYDQMTPSVKFGKYEQRLETRNTKQVSLVMTPTDKLISKIRETRKDIFLVGFKTTCGATEQEMYEKGLRLLKESHVNLCLVNDVKTRLNMIVTPEEASYHETTDREEALKQLVDMAYFRSHLKFTQSNVVAGEPVSWEDKRVPKSLRAVVEHCIVNNAYKPFNGATVGHFAIKLKEYQK
jgi:hypothetical protein